MLLVFVDLDAHGGVWATRVRRSVPRHLFVDHHILFSPGDEDSPVRARALARVKDAWPEVEGALGSDRRTGVAVSGASFGRQGVTPEPPREMCSTDASLS